MDELTKQSLSDLQIAVSEQGKELNEIKEIITGLRTRIVNLEGHSGRI